MTVATTRVTGRYGEYTVGGLVSHGGTAELSSVDDPKDPPLLYKRFYEALNGDHILRIAELVEVGRESRTRGRVQDDVRRIAWPVDLVQQRNQVAGVLIPRAGTEYFINVSRHLTQNLSHLSAVQAPAIKVRLRIVRQLASALTLLGQHDLVHGDVSGTNVLWCLQPRPEMLLIDCDGLHPRSFQMPPYSTPFWTDPRLEAKLIAAHDVRSDWYALALSVYRVILRNSRATPDAADIKRIRATFPELIAEPLIDTFSYPLEGSVRIKPNRWKSLLSSVIEDEADCRRLATLSDDLPTKIADRRRANNGPPRSNEPRRARPKPDTPSGHPTTSRPQRTPSPADKRPPDPKPKPKRRALPKLIAGGSFVAVLIFSLYCLTGLPNWRILNAIDFFLTTSQRSLVAALPSGIKHCRGEPTVSAHGALSTVRCEWAERELLAIKFDDATSLHAYYRRRLKIGARLMTSRHRPSDCPRSGDWYFERRPGAIGNVTSFISVVGARLDWSRRASLTYLIGLGRVGELSELCAWWGKLNEP